MWLSNSLTGTVATNTTPTNEVTTNIEVVMVNGPSLKTNHRQISNATAKVLTNLTTNDISQPKYFSYKDFTGYDFDGWILTNFNLSNHILTAANLSQANLKRS